MLGTMDQIEIEAEKELQKVGDEDALQRWKVVHLGRSSQIMRAFRPARRAAKR